MKFSNLRFVLAGVFACMCFLNCKGEEAAGPKNRIMGTGEPTTVRPLTADDRYLEAARQGDLAGLRREMAAGANVNARDALGNTAFFLAVSKTDDLALIEFLREGSAPGTVDRADARGRTPLSRAAERGKNAIIEYLLKAGAKVDSKDADGRTPLFHAALAGEAAAVRRLRAAGAKVDPQDIFGDTPLMMAALRGKTAVVRTLLAAGAERTLKNQEGQTAADRVRDESLRALLR